MPHTKRFFAACLVFALILIFPTPLFAQKADASELPCASLPLSAEAAILIDAQSGKVLYQKNAAARLPMASTTKIMTALVVAEQADIFSTVRIDARAVGIEGSSIYLYEGEYLTVEQLLYALLLESANDASVALALTVSDSVEDFAALMNEKAATLGLQNTHFENPHGLDATEHYTTAHDLAIIAAAALQNPTLKKIMSTKRMTVPLCNMAPPEESKDTSSDEAAPPIGTRVLLNHNKMLRTYPGAIGVKTGYTKRSGRCLVSAAERDGLTLVAVTLNAPDDWNDHTRLLDLGFDSYVRVTLCERGAYRTMLPTVGGVEEYVLVNNAEGCTVTLPRGHSAITCTVELPRFCYAPIDKGERIGRLLFWCDANGDGMGEQIGCVSLQTIYGVDKLPPPTVWERIRAFFRSLFSRND